MVWDMPVAPSYSVPEARLAPNSFLNLDPLLLIDLLFLLFFFSYKSLNFYAFAASIYLFLSMKFLLEEPEEPAVGGRY